MLHGQHEPQSLANAAAVAAANSNGSGAPMGKRAAAAAAAAAALAEQRARHNGEPLLAFFGVCIPFGPPSLLEMPSKDSVFKSKHKL